MKTIGILLLLCASANAQALWFKSNSLDWQMVAQSTTGIYEDGPLVADDATAASHNPATGRMRDVEVSSMLRPTLVLHFVLVRFAG